MSDPDPVVGHKTFHSPERGYWHEPVRKSEADALLAAIEAAKAKRAADMPDERAALNAMHDAWTRLKELGWREAIYCPKDGTLFDAIEAGSTGIHACRYVGKWASGHWEIVGDGDIWPAHPILFRLSNPLQGEGR